MWGDVITRSNLISTQNNDPELKSLYSGALSETEAASYPCCYFLQNDSLMRKRRPPNASVNDEWLGNIKLYGWSFGSTQDISPCT